MTPEYISARLKQMAESNFDPTLTDKASAVKAWDACVRKTAEIDERFEALTEPSLEDYQRRFTI